MKQELIVKSNVLIQHPLYKRTTELKIFSRIILAIRDDPQSNVFSFQIRELLEKFQGGADNYTELKQIAKGMFRVVDLNPSEKTFHLSAIFTDIFTHEEGQITFEVNQKVKPFFLDLTTNFTQYYFENIARLKSSFSIRIYELLKQYEKIGSRKPSLTELKDFLGITKDQYAKYSNFKNKVLLVAYNELKEKTDIYFEFEEIKKGRKIAEINFIIFKNNKNSTEVQSESVINQVSKDQESLINKLVENYKLSKKVATDLVLAVNPQQIENNIVYAEREYQSGVITKNFAGFLIEAIKNNYAGNISLFDLENKKQKEQEKRKVENNERKENLIATLTKNFGIQERNYFLSKITQDQEQQIIAEILNEVRNDPYTTEQVKKKGLKTPLIHHKVNQRIEGFEARKQIFIAEGLRKAGLEV